MSATRRTRPPTRRTRPPPDGALPWEDYDHIFEDDIIDDIEELKITMQDMHIDVNDMFYRYYPGGGQPVILTLLSAAVEWGAPVETVTYLKAIGADSHQKVDNGEEFDWGFDMNKALRQDEWVDNDWLGTPEYEVAKEMWTEFVSNKYNMSREVCRDIIDMEGHNWIELHRAQDGEPYVRVHSRSLGIGDGYDIGRIRIWTEEDTEQTMAMFRGSRFNSNQRAIILHGRDSLIARVVRGESTEIAAGYKKGFEAFCHYAELRRVKQNRHCSLSLAKKDNRLWYLLMGLYAFGIPEELREAIVGLAFFGNGPKTGKGKRTYPNGSVYEGEFKDGLPHGHGQLCCSKGTHEGAFKDGLPHGKGKRVLCYGNMFEGEFKDGNPDEGKYLTKDGILVCKFLNNRAHGPGTTWDTDGKADIQVYDMGVEKGRGVQWNEDRTLAWELHDGSGGRSISLQEAADFAASLNLSVPAVRDFAVNGGW